MIDIIDEICEKYGYDGEDKEGNDSLKTVLSKLIPIMLKDAKPSDRELFYQMLRNTPIIITENITEESYKSLREQYLGDVEGRIIEESDFGEYGKTIGAGAYVSEPDIDENLKLQGKKSFLYIQKVQGQEKEFLGTDINVSHLCHELGHAWHAQKNQYAIEKDGILRERIGTIEYKYSLSKLEDGKIVRKLEDRKGIMIEEAMNTIAEENAIAEYIGISLEELKKSPLTKSTYQGYMTSLTRYMLQKLGKEDFENWRLYGDKDSKAKIEGLMSRTDYWKNRLQDIQPNSGSPRSYDKKREVISGIKSLSVQEFFKDNEGIYFPDMSQMTPLDKIDNVLEQSYTMHMARYNMGIENYKALLECMGWESYSLINQSEDVKKKDELFRTIADVRLSEVNDLTQYTKSLAQDKKVKEGDKEIGESR